MTSELPASVPIVNCDPVTGYASAIGRYVAQLTETRQELLAEVKKLTPAQLAWHPQDDVESIGTQLLHVAAIEWSWILEDIFGRDPEEYDGWHEALPLRLGLPQVSGQPLAYFTDRLQRVRAECFGALRSLTDDDLARLVPTNPSEPPSEMYTIDWVLFHLVDHEARHAGQVELLARLLPPLDAMI